MTNQKLPQPHPSLVEFARQALTGRTPTVASIMADAYGCERDRRIAELEAELATLRQRLADRETVEEFCSHPRRELSVDPFDKTVMIGEEFLLTPNRFSGETLDSAFSAAAEWVRGQA